MRNIGICKKFYFNVKKYERTMIMLSFVKDEFDENTEDILKSINKMIEKNKEENKKKQKENEENE